MQFYKIQALGNDFVVFGGPSKSKTPDNKLIRLLCSRRYGVGADCAIFISKSDNADYFMHVYNPDGFEAEICGNALRCSAKYVTDCGYFKKKLITVETLSGLRILKINENSITAQIGSPEIISKGCLEVSGVTLPYTAVSMGNPHCVIFTNYGLSDDVFNHYGYAIEHHPMFPEGTNVEFASVNDNERIVMRVWERGIGETLSCSTGSCACVAAAQFDGLCGSKVQVYQPGGIIEVETDENETMYITGKCEIVFKGNFLV